MIHVYMDDCRTAPPGFVLARTPEECLLLLRECEVGILSLDYDMGYGRMNGGEVAAAMVSESLYPQDIYLHTSSPQGRKVMFELLYYAIPEGTRLHNGPMDLKELQQAGRGSGR